MNNSIKNVFILGGTGFLGYYSSLEFLKKGIAVSSASIPDVKLGDWFPKQVNIISEDLNVFTASEDEIVEVLKGHDAMVYGIGPDDRFTPDAPSYDFFYDKLVTQCTKAVRAAKRAGCKKCVVMNSYFAYFNRQPEFDGKLAKNHPYIRVRVEQAAACINEGKEGEFEVVILELPYIFGSMPGREPLWKSVFLDRFEKLPAVFFPKGGTVMIHVRGIAEAVVAATLNGKHGGRYPIGVTNMKYKEMIRTMYDAIGNKKKIITIPTWMAYLGGVVINSSEKKKGKEGGLNYAKLMPDIQARNMYYSPETIQKVMDELGYKELGFNTSLDVKKGIETTMQACYPEKFPDSDPATQVREDLAIIDKIWSSKTAPKKEDPKPAPKTEEVKPTPEKEVEKPVVKKAPATKAAPAKPVVKKESAPKAAPAKPAAKKAPATKAAPAKPAVKKETAPKTAPKK